jgi:hypothetical protein
MTLIDKLDIRQFCFVEDNPHDSLSGSDRAVDLGMNFVNANRITLADESIKDILAKLFAFNHYFFAGGVNLFIKDC